MKKYRRTLLMLGIVSLVFILSACSNKPITNQSTGIWDGLIVLNFSRAIIWLAHFFGNSYGMGIILFTIIIRIILLPLMIFQTRSMRKTQEIQPKVKALQKKYSSKDRETVQKLQAEQQKLYSEAGINPLLGCLPALVQLPIIWALYQAIWRTEILRSGSFLWLQLGHKDPYFILPILAALATMASSWLTTKSAPETSSMNTMMVFGMPVVVFFTALNVPSSLSLYWTISYVFQVGQTLLIQNPWKIQAERDAKEKAQADHERAVRRAIRKAKQSRRK
ncbi:YidC/Oxa1 family membrane protein insertase [Levilactobacillus zymae]|uniref:YidC/Oxa1 family membrane protein insertase n=1 Tax=Levilactobacillus zymae TaxID=267363 RepID=UPI0028B89DAF|nr:YidC/Oxa1 family membrane protein insertase [Levilactobacillus zymae]MDT6979422.1 YidC/Oxa1 family membrane protein insertase [Levilactobacillus zymae]